MHALKTEEISEIKDTNAPIHLDTDARNKRLLDTFLAQGLWAEPELNEAQLVTCLRVSVTNPGQGHCQG